MVVGPSSNRRLIQMMPLLRPPAGMAEVVKGAGLKIRSHMGSWVRIPLPAPFFYSIHECQYYRNPLGFVWSVLILMKRDRCLKL